MISIKKNIVFTIVTIFLHTPFVGAQEDPASTSLLSLLGDGGILMLPIGFCSLILVMFSFERVMSLRRNRIIPRPFVRRILEQLKSGEIDKREAYRLCKENKSPMADVFSAALRRWGRPSTEVEQAMVDAGERLGNRLRKYLRLFNGISTITPLLGLLGTVIGMIRAFNAIVVVGAMGKPELLAAGIGQALITTAAGLTVAIPALIAYLYFTGRVEQILMRVDEHGQQIVRSISAEGLNRTKRKQVRLTAQQQAA